MRSERWIFQIFVSFLRDFLTKASCSLSVATVSRLARRLNIASNENKEKFEKNSGILEGKTVHGQVLKVHSSDVLNKANLLLDFQRKQLAELYELRDQENDQDFRKNLRQGSSMGSKSIFWESAKSLGSSPGAEIMLPWNSVRAWLWFLSNNWSKNRLDYSSTDLTPAEVFAIGMVKPTSDSYSTPTFCGLLANLSKMQKPQWTRFGAQILSIMLANILAMAFLKTPPKHGATGRLFMTNFSSCFLRISQPLLGLFYEAYSPEIASGRGKRISMAFWWLMVQIPIFLYPLKLMVHGGIGRESPTLRAQVVVRMKPNLVALNALFVIPDCGHLRPDSFTYSFRISNVVGASLCSGCSRPFKKLISCACLLESTNG